MYDGNCNVKFSIKTDKQPKGFWSFGMGLSHMMEETYVYVNFFKWSVFIGFLYEFREAEEVYDEF